MLYCSTTRVFCTQVHLNALTEDHSRTIQVNVNGVLNGCHSGFEHLKANTHGARVINLSSTSAIYGQTNLASYSASKFAVRGLTEALDNEWKSSRYPCDGHHAHVCGKPRW